MAQLPIYRQQQNISLGTPDQVKNVDKVDYTFQTSKTLQETGNLLMGLAAQWQESKDAVENLDGKNKLNSGIAAILDEAANYNDYSTPEQLSQKQNELTQKMNDLVPNIVSGFSNNQKAREFEMNGQYATEQNIYKLQSIFRDKQIDMGRAGLVESQRTNMENFISTGNIAFKESYLNDLNTMAANGIVDKEYVAKMSADTDKWDVYHVMRAAESDPEEVMKNLKAGAYDIKPEYMNELLGDLTRIKTNNQLIREFDEIRKQNDGENKAAEYIYSNASFEEKQKYIDEQEFLGNISESFAAKARRNIKQFKPDAEKSESSAQSVSDIMAEAYDLNEGNLSKKDYLIGIKNLRERILELQTSGDITTGDAAKLERQLTNATNKKVAEATKSVSFGYGEARKYIEQTLPPEQRAEAYRSIFYATADKDLSGMNKKQQQEIYMTAAREAVQGINSNNRSKALQVTRPAQIGDTWQGHRINSLYGKRTRPTAGASTDHKGIDLSYKNNENIGAFTSGTVVKVVNDQGKSKKGYGNYVDIKSADGTIHRYAHANKITVKVGQKINAGTTIAKAGSTGASTGTHLHYEKIKNGKSINPMSNQTTSSGVRIKAPNGTIVLVPQNKVNEAIKKGGRRA